AGDRERLLKSHESELAALNTELHLSALAKEQAESQLAAVRADLEKEHDARESTVKELGSRLGNNIRDLQNQIEERDMLVQARDGEIHSLKAEVHALSAKFDEAQRVSQQAETALNAALSKGQSISDEKAATVRALEERHSKSLRQLESQLG